MTDEAPLPEATVIWNQLLRQQERTIQLLQSMKDEMEAPINEALIAHLRQSGSGHSEAAEGILDVVAKLEEALRTARYCQSELHREVLVRGDATPEGPDNLPTGLARFLLERQDTPGFTYEVRQDAIRGWIIRWKEYTERGTVRGSGQFYERPYAWLQE